MVIKTRRIKRGESSGGRRLGVIPGRASSDVERRLAFIENRLFWIGSVNRTDVTSRFDVSMSQASGDIARYLALQPRGVAYDKSAKRYVAGDAFRPVHAEPDAARFLGELRLVEAGLLASADSLLGETPPFATTPVPERAVDPLVLRLLLRGLRDRRALSVRYQSMSRPEPTQRLIEPHALAHDGFRWHVRAFDHETNEFRDFVIGRMTSARLDAPARSRPDQDRDWQTFVTLQIAPHPKLTEAQRKAIAVDYGIRGQSTNVRVRRSLLFYALKRLGLDVAANTRPPHEQHIVLLNRKEVEAASSKFAET